MTRQPARFPLDPRRNACAALVVVAVLTAAGLAAAEAFTPEPSSLARVVAIGGKDYLELGPNPVTMTLVGPGRLYGFMRVGFAPGENGERAGSLEIAGIGERTMRLPLTFSPSPSTTFDDGRPTVPSGGRKFEFYVPAGIWTARLTASVDGGGLAAAIFYYDGPSQSSRPADADARPNPWRYRNSFTAEFIYDDNVYTLHPQAIDDFLVGLDPGLPRMKSYDDFVFAPTLDLSAERQFWSLGKTRLRFKVKRWMYTVNPIKTNTDFDAYVRQYFGGSRSLELYLHHAPEQYIRQLGDRSPYGGVSEDREFRFTRNIVNLTWRHTLSRDLSYSVTAESNMRYYNKPFMENDVATWELRGSVAYRFFARKLRVTVDYSFEDAAGRGYDSVDESHDHSDDSDPGYHRDLYRLGLDLKTPWLRPLADDVGVAYLFMDYYYTTTKDLFDSPYQVGRRDKWAKAFLKASKALTRGVDLDFDFVYSERQVESPWYGDITLDKDYISHRYSLALSYDF
ncbi:MAG: hypothetical protein R3D98_12770 [Candidatus Krumholzibacteriia bacterium]